MTYIKHAKLQDGLAMVIRFDTSLNVSYFRKSPPSFYAGIVRDDGEPASILEFARDAHYTPLPNPKDFRPTLDELLAAFPDAPDDARQLIKVLYSSN